MNTATKSHNNSIVIDEVKIILSILWVFVLINMIYADIIGMMRPNYLETLERLSKELSEETVLFFAVLMEIPIIMIPISLLLKRKANRVINFIAVPLCILWVVVPALMPSLGDDTPLSYVFFATVEVIAMIIIFRSSLKWSKEA